MLGLFNALKLNSFRYVVINQIETRGILCYVQNSQL